MFVYSLTTRDDRLQIFRVTPTRPWDCFRSKQWGKCHGYGAQTIISWPVGYAAKRVRPTWLFLGRDDSSFRAHARLTAGD